MKNDELPDQPLSDDPEENLRMENELLRLKLKAELGGDSHSSGNLPPEIENEFLKNVMAFEQNWAKAKDEKPVKVYDLLGKPSFKKSEELGDEELEKALKELYDLLAEKNIEVYFGDDDGYDSRTRYHFITDELFDHETTFMPMPGMTTYFDYEEFHPNHKKDIEKHALKFLSAWIEKDIKACGWELAHDAILPDKKILSKAEVITQIEHIFSFSNGFTEAKHELFDIGFDLNAGMGHAEGGLKYMVGLKNGEAVPVGGAFKLYFSLDDGYWSIVYMILPGFKYP
jgi:hypothetical protein